MEYKFYACCKNSSNGGTCFISGRDTCREAFEDLKRLEIYIGKDTIFAGVIRCNDGEPLKHIVNEDSYGSLF